MKIAEVRELSDKELNERLDAEKNSVRPNGVKPQCISIGQSD